MKGIGIQLKDKLFATTAPERRKEKEYSKLLFHNNVGFAILNFSFLLTHRFGNSATWQPSLHIETDPLLEIAQWTFGKQWDLPAQQPKYSKLGHTPIPFKASAQKHWKPANTENIGTLPQ